MQPDPVHPDVVRFLQDAPKKMIIGGEKTASISGKTYTAYNPSTGEALVEVYSAAAEDIDCAVEAARKAMHGPWPTMLCDQRESIMRRFAALIEEHAEELAQLESLDNGKPISKTRSIDAPVAASNMYHWAGWPSRIHGETPVVSIPNHFAYTRREPVGVVAIIFPWNYPLIHYTQKSGPALAAGNAVILKPASVASLACIRLGELAQEAGFPPGVFNVVTGPGGVIGEALSSHPHIDKIQVTGSTGVGRRIIQNSTINIKRVSLELGSKAPNCVFEDADLEKAIPGAFHAAFGNTGQSCVAGCRLYVQRPVLEKVLEGLQALAGQARIGVAMDTQTEMGPIIDAAQYRTIMEYVEEGRKSGAAILSGGERLSGNGLPEGGYYLSPTIITGAGDDDRISQEEIFGPVVTVYPFDTEEEAIARANHTTYGLAAGLWTENVARAHRVAAQIKAGVVWVNTYDMFNSTVPFGGYKQSGYGRDNSESAIDAVTETKSVWIALK
ncbi:MAG: aldehyde dehydrogenase family protein [Anaerolineaceae bacterium]|nr:aldehyde dehydrogenase family protein [Anaerolineaceae bacterium]